MTERKEPQAKRWETRTIDGVAYTFDHLLPFDMRLTRLAKGALAALDVSIRVVFDCHVVTEDAVLQRADMAGAPDKRHGMRFVRHRPAGCLVGVSSAIPPRDAGVQTERGDERVQRGGDRSEDDGGRGQQQRGEDKDDESGGEGTHDDSESAYWFDSADNCRRFNLERYEWSHSLRQLITGLVIGGTKCYVAKKNNYMIWKPAAIEVDGPHYQVYFNIYRPGSEAYLVMYVQSAYVKGQPYKAQREDEKPFPRICAELLGLVQKPMKGLRNKAKKR